VDQLRYFFLREMVYGLDAHFSIEALISRINADLANDLGNLVARSLGMAFKYRKGVVPAPGQPGDQETNIENSAIIISEAFLTNFPALEFPRVLVDLWDFIRMLNRYIVKNAPWELAKESSPAASQRLDTVLYNLLESQRWIAMLLRPVMPRSAMKICEQLGLDPESWNQPFDQVLGINKWGSLVSGSHLKKGPALFPRIETEPEAGK
jgi:methionyl-tRNA synthetase